MSNSITSLQQNDLPWIVFKVAEQKYCLNSASVISINMLPEITSLPQSPSFLRGMADLRGELVPAIGLRAVLGVASIQDDYDGFKGMIDQRKADHINWVEQLKVSVRDEAPFSLATDPHKCAFGKWYDTFETKNLAVAHHLAKIATPHALLHQCATDALSCSRQHDKCTRKKCLKNALYDASDIYMPQVVALLDQTKDIFRDEFREMLIGLSVNGMNFAIIIDQVCAVKRLDFIENDLDRFCSTQYVIGVANKDDSAADDDGKNILALDIDKLAALVSQ